MNSDKNVYIIAEAGVNHNQSEKLAFELVDAAKEAGADCVKFQTFKAENLVTRSAPKAPYQKITTGKTESQFDMLKRLELSHELHEKLIKHCARMEIEFMSTPFDLPSLDYLVHQLCVHQIKIPSGEINNAPLLLQAARSNKPIILSTGNSTVGEVEDALGVLAFGYLQPNEKPSVLQFNKAFCSYEGRQLLRKNVRLLHCTSEYPTPFEDVNLRAMKTLEYAFGLPVGLSDHTPGISVATASVALGAKLIEKHFTMDKNLPGPDHRASLDPLELKALVQSVRQVELALGSSIKGPAPSELKNREVARKSLVSLKPIQKGELFSEKNLTIKRPASGVSPFQYWDYLGKVSDRDYEGDEIIF